MKQEISQNKVANVLNKLFTSLQNTVVTNAIRREQNEENLRKQKIKSITQETTPEISGDKDLS